MEVRPRSRSFLRREGCTYPHRDQPSRSLVIVALETSAAGPPSGPVAAAAVAQQLPPATAAGRGGDEGIS